MVLLAQSLYRDFPEYCHYFKIKRFDYGNQSFHNHNKLLGQIPGLEGIKTGYVAKAGFCISTAAIRMTPNQERVRLFAVVLGGDTAKNRDRKTREILEKHFQKIGAISNNSQITSNPQLIPAVQFTSASAKKSPSFSRSKSNIFLKKTTSLKKHKSSVKTKILAPQTKRIPKGWGRPLKASFD